MVLRNRKWLILLISLGMLFPPGMVAAGEFTLIPSVSLQESYNSNIFLDPSGKVDDFITTITPGLKVRQNTERLDFDVSASVSQLLYASNSGLNTLDQYYLGNARYRFTPRLSVAGSSGYITDAQPDRDILTTGLALTTTTRYRQFYSLSADYALSEKTVATVSSGYDNDSYGQQHFRDFEGFSAQLGLTHDLSSVIPALQGRANVGYYRYLIPGLTVDNYTVTVGASLSISEIWKLLFEGGVRFTRQKADPVEEKQTGFVGQLTLSRQGERTTWNLGISQQLLPASGSSGTSNRTAFLFDISHRFTYELSGTFYASYFLNKSDAGRFAVQTLDQTTYVVGPGLRYAFNKDVSLDGSYRYIWQNNRQTNTRADQHVFLVRLVLQHTLFE